MINTIHNDIVSVIPTLHVDVFRHFVLLRSAPVRVTVTAVCVTVTRRCAWLTAVRVGVTEREYADDVDEEAGNGDGLKHRHGNEMMIIINMILFATKI